MKPIPRWHTVVLVSVLFGAFIAVVVSLIAC